MSWRKFGSEWNPVLVVLAIVVVLCILAYVSAWAGIVGLTLTFCGLVIWAYVNG